MYVCVCMYELSFLAHQNAILWNGLIHRYCVDVNEVLILVVNVVVTVG